MRPYLVSAILISAVIVTLFAGAAPGAVPPGGRATLSLVDDERVELVYQGRTLELPAASFSQTLAVMAIAAGIPAGPWTPSLVDAALHAAGIPHLDARSAWPGDGALVVVPTAPVGAVDAALGAAGTYYDPTTQPREFAAAYWQALYGTREAAEAAPPGWPGQPTLEALKATIVGALPFPANLGPMPVYQARGVVPFLYLVGEMRMSCFLFICWWWPAVRVRITAVPEGYGLPDVR